jgi:hypothetical protein
MRLSPHRPLVLALGVLAGIGVLTLSALALHARPNVATAFGVTFSPLYAESLGTNWQEAYIAVLDDLGVRHLRIPAYWSEIEPDPGVFRFDDLDWMLSEAEARGARVTLAIGRKLPRWPECYIPDWAEGLDEAAAEEALLLAMQTTVERYRDQRAIVRWQVENEAFFPFGVCPPPSTELFEREIALVRSLDDRSIMLTVSGELDPWIDAAEPADVLGISSYRVTWNKLYGFFYYPIGPSYYRLRARAVSHLVDAVIVSELQAEPWFERPPSEMTTRERANAFTGQDLRNNVEFIRQAGFPEAYLWGVEWWFAQKQLGEDELWEEAREVFK